jgi:hypothetical protein
MCLAQRNACAGSHGIAKGCNLSGRGLRVMARNWQRTRNILAYPHAWQRPAKTEEWAYERCLADLPENRYVQFVFFPWATLIDLLRAERTEKAQPFLDALKAVPPRTTLIRATVCQHIYAKDLLPWFKCLKITDLFWSHATREESAIEGLRVHPFPLYPVRCAEYPEIPASGGKPLSERKYLYSFIGTYESGLYLSPVRQWIFDLPLRADAPVESRPEWHYEKLVYDEQVGGRPLSEADSDSHRRNSRRYAEVLQETVFSLCPSGSGPNSIRLWESIGFGCIPVILSDTLRLPGDESLWTSAAIAVEETRQAVQALPHRLEAMIRDSRRLDAMRSAGRELWAQYGLESLSVALAEWLEPVMGRNVTREHVLTGKRICH